MTPRQQRMLLVGLMLVGVSIAAFLGLRAADDSLFFFHSPTAVANGDVETDKNFRLGGLVVEGSVEREPGSLKVHFVLTDTANNVPVEYEGILPDLFREGQGIVANGKLNANGVFVAAEVLAKHDENYMPPEVEESVRLAHEQGVARKKAAEKAAETENDE